MLPEAPALRDKRRQQAPAQILPDLQRKGLERKEAFSADLIFGSFYQEKEQSLPAAIERDDAHSVNTESTRKTNSPTGN